MKMTVDDFIAKALSFCKTKLAPKLTEESNKVTLGVKLYFAPKKIKQALSSPEARDTIMTPDGYIDVGEVEGAIMNGFEYGSKYPFLGICDLNRADVEEFFTFLKGATL